MDFEVHGVNTTVAQTQAQLENAIGNVTDDDTRAADGCVTLSRCLSVIAPAGTGRNVLHCREPGHAGRPVFPERLSDHQGKHTVRSVFDNFPGHIYHARVITISERYRRGQVRCLEHWPDHAFGGTTTFPA